MKPPETGVISSDELPAAALQMFFDGVHGTYDLDTERVEIGLVGVDAPWEMAAEVINHEYLHHVLHHVINEEASVDLDNIDTPDEPLCY